MKYIVGEKLLWIPWTTRKMSRRVLEQIKPETLTKVKLSYLTHIRGRQGSLGKTLMLGK